MNVKLLLDETENKLDSFLNNYNKEQPLVLYGYGGGITNMPQMFKEYGINVVAICDRDKEKQGKEYCGIPVLSFEKVMMTYPYFNIYIVVSNYFDEIETFLKANIAQERIFAFGRRKNMTPNMYLDYLIKNEYELNEIYYKLNDEKSRKTMECVIKGTLSNDLDYFKAVFEDNQYFNTELISLSKEEVFVDAGAFDGDTITQFLSNTGNNYKKIYAFEPDFKSAEKMKQKLFNLNMLEKIEIVNAGIFSRNDILNFESGLDKGSHINIKDNLNNSVKVVSLDQYIYGRVSFIKMDVEGCELEALKGAEKIIKKYKPILAICIYHKLEDIIEIPRYIMSLGLDYKYYIRHHSYSVDETVFYAI